MTRILPFAAALACLGAQTQVDGWAFLACWVGFFVFAALAARPSHEPEPAVRVNGLVSVVPDAAGECAPVDLETSLHPGEPSPTAPRVGDAPTEVTP